MILESSLVYDPASSLLGMFPREILPQANQKAAQDQAGKQWAAGSPDDEWEIGTDHVEYVYCEVGCSRQQQ